MRLEKGDPSAYRRFAEALRPLDPYLGPPHLAEFHAPGPETLLGRFKPLWMPLVYCEEFVSEGRKLLLLEVAEVEVAFEGRKLASLRVRADDRLATQDLPAEEGVLKALRGGPSRHYSFKPPVGNIFHENPTTLPDAIRARLEAMRVERLEFEGWFIPAWELAERLRVYEEWIRAECIEVEPLEMEHERPLEFVLKRESKELRRMAAEAK
ncbi:MAG: hypothetical protein QXO51_02705 [Halobacteria archaeon]